MKKTNKSNYKFNVIMFEIACPRMKEDYFLNFVQFFVEYLPAFELVNLL